MEKLTDAEIEKRVHEVWAGNCIMAGMPPGYPPYSLATLPSRPDRLLSSERGSIWGRCNECEPSPRRTIRSRGLHRSLHHQYLNPSESFDEVHCHPTRCTPYGYHPQQRSRRWQNALHSASARRAQAHHHAEQAWYPHNRDPHSTETPGNASCSVPWARIPSPLRDHSPLHTPYKCSHPDIARRFSVVWGAWLIDLPHPSQKIFNLYL